MEVTVLPPVLPESLGNMREASAKLKERYREALDPSWIGEGYFAPPSVRESVAAHRTL